MRSSQSISKNILDEVKLSQQEMIKYARDLSLVQKVYWRKSQYRHVNLGEVQRNIENAYSAAKKCKYDGSELPAISEWFYDNRYLFIEQIKQIETKDERYRLPMIKNGRYENYPRSLVLAVEIAKRSSFYITTSSIKEFLIAYQEESELESGELWVFADMLKIALLIAVSELGILSIEWINMREKAETLWSRLERGESPVARLLGEFKGYLKNPVFVEHLSMLMRENPSMTQVLEKIDAKLETSDLSIDKLIKKAHSAQARDIMHISNAITSLRTLAKLNFEQIFEDVSAVQRHLAEDEEYLDMDFNTREYYRKNVTDIARVMKASEPAVSRAAIRLAKNIGEHVGMFIAGDRRQELMGEFGALPIRVKINGFFKKHMLFFYAGGAVISSVISAAILCISLFFMLPPVYGILGFVISFIPIYAVSIAISNRIFTLLNKPAFIPKMELKEGIPEDCATIVVIPTIVTGILDAEEILEKMQVYYAANQQKNLYFMLLSDFKENKEEISEGEAEAIEGIAHAVEALNDKYEKPLFFYAQRRRTYNKEKEIYSGRERKRGALLDFCTLIKGNKTEFVYVTEGIPRKIKYVITLDADTELSRDAAIKLIGSMEHPLNRPIIDTKTNTVKSGYGVMQPRIGVDVVSAAKTRFSLVFSGKGGLDTYACASSDIYQDGFGTGIYTGKGIFELDIYQKVLNTAFPDNAVLSHDLLEGGYIRCALVTDVVLMDGCPAKYASWADRQHRWIRGDWQLLPWLGRYVMTKEGRRKNPLSKLTKYQIIDNMRRSLVMPLCFMVILLSQTAFYRSAFFWFISGMLPLFIDGILDFVNRIISLIRNAGKGSTVRDAWQETKTLFEQSFYKFAFLPYEAFMVTDAVIRTIVRVVFTKKKMLEWVTAAEGEKKAKDGIHYYLRKMMAAPILATALYALSIAATGKFSLIAFAVFTLWFFAPSIAYYISKPRRVKKYVLDGKQKAYIEDAGLSTWRFFEKFGQESDFGWMPDNFQQSPGRGVAMRTSPTNIAFSMTSGIIACYLGFVTFEDALLRLEKCVDGIEKAPKWEGHLFNWYDIEDLSPLEPRYVSSVDSGNLACYLIVADEAINDILRSPIAAYLKRGIGAVSRESGNETSPVIEENIFNAVEFIEKIENKSDIYGEYIKSYRAYFEKYAAWAPTFMEFSQNHFEKYSEPLCGIENKLGEISIAGFANSFNALLEILSDIVVIAEKNSDDVTLNWVKKMEKSLGESYAQSRKLTEKCKEMSNRMMKLYSGMDFKKLYDEAKGLFSIGYDARHEKLSDTHYDLLASEARQTGFIAIAKGDAPLKHWFRLARPLTVAGDNRVLLSWGGTMFEYLMPLIIMRSYDNTLLGETYRTVVEMQYGYGEQRRVPWGVSESGYYAFDLDMNYQYKAFGVPGLGLKSGLVREMVISPYSTFLALPVNPKAAFANLLRLEKIGASGKYGFYEAVDYTQSRMQRGRKKRIIKSYMAHHQGMILASILNCLMDWKMQDLFHSAMSVKATELLLKEKVPPRNITLSLGEKQPEKQEFVEEIHSARTFKHFMQYPEAHFLSNGSYTVMLTQYGTGYSMFRGSMINRWYGDFLRRAPGMHIYIKDTESGAVWSAAFLPSCVAADQERVVFEQHKASYVREIEEIETTLEICVSPECNMEIRSIEIYNKSEKQRRLSVYCVYTPALCSEREFEAHPAFAELFIETEADSSKNTIYARRRGRSLHNAVKVCGGDKAELMTDRARIFGRRSVFGAPACALSNRSEKDATRAIGIKCGIDVSGKSSRSLAFVIAIAESKQEVMQYLDTISGEDDVKRAFHLAYTHSQVEMRYLKLKNMQANLFQRIASRTVISIPYEPKHIQIQGKVETLWKMGISGDLPIICMLANDAVNIESVRTVAKAQEFMSLRGVSADLVIIYKGGGEYICPLRDRIKELETAASGRPYNRIYALARECLSDEDISTLLNASCVVMEDSSPLEEQLKTEMNAGSFEVFEKRSECELAVLPAMVKAYDNGTGGFINNGREYCIDVTEAAPYPWSNIMVNTRFGTLISAGGGGYTWGKNAQMDRLTPFRNDSLTDLPGEGIIVRNDRTGEIFSITPDTNASGKYRVTHGFGYSTFERFGGIYTNAIYFVDKAMPVKSCVLNIKNETDKAVELSVYFYAEPAFAARCRSVTASYKNSMLSAHAALGERNMFIAIPGEKVRYTTSAFEFFGPPGHNIIPEAVKKKELSNRLGAATLLALQAKLYIESGEKKEITTLLGCGTKGDAENCLTEYSSFADVMRKLEETKNHWNELVGDIRITTKSKSMDILVNGWLLYETYAARIWGRTGYYQSGGAYGFRDQLQDAIALIYTNPRLTRELIVAFAGRQFKEGDVLHWWHEKAHGVRTRISDDKLFLPYAACEYEKITGDIGLFGEQVKYLKGESIPEGRHDLYKEFEVDEEIESVYMHCKRAIDSALKLGEHGLPLMGTGDWNDGMDKVGENGKGESVWLGFFLSEVLRSFSGVCRRMGEEKTAAEYEEWRKQLQVNIEKYGWDGEWYRRAYFDDGTPLGSRESQECSIDLISQAWAVIAGAANSHRAFEAADELLVMREEGVIRLLSPAFDRWEKNPGYIKSYLPGVRENGGQYTHAAAWYVIAAAKLREKDKALALFQMINPINHTRTPEGVAKYKGEPYVAAGDVYYTDEQKGRAGWTWYTGAAGWMYQAAVIHLLGMKIEREELHIEPCLPDDFGKYTIEYKKGGALYIINVELSAGYEGRALLSIDGGDEALSVKLDKTEGEHKINACWRTATDDILKQ